MKDNRENNNFNDTLRREFTRAILERAQGMKMPALEDDSVPSNVEEELNIAYVNRQEIPLALDIFKPKSDDETELPVVVTIQGGGLVFGDRRRSRQYAREIARRGYLVFSIEYRLAPRANVCEQLDDVCAGLDFIGRRLVDYNVDFNRMFMTAESAGCYLAVYSAAMKDSEKLQNVIGYKPSRMRFRALGLDCGMLYTNRDDMLGIIMSEQFYGDQNSKKNFLQYMDPEHHEIINHLPPVLLMTNRGDLINRYSIMYHEALKKAHKRTKLLYYGEKSLGHASVLTRPKLPQSQDAIDRMLTWFEEQAKEDKAERNQKEEDKKSLSDLSIQIEQGLFEQQKVYKGIQAFYSFSDIRLDKRALLTDSQAYSYRDIFDKWEAYARVFSGLGMTESNGTRVGIPGAMTAQATFAVFGLNMTGAVVSLLPYEYMDHMELLKKAIRREKLTDLILTDWQISSQALAELISQKEDLQLRNIIVLHTKVTGPCANQADRWWAAVNWNHIQSLNRLQMMSKLLKQYEQEQIQYGSEACDREAILLHSVVADGEGLHQSVSLTDRDVNRMSIEAVQNPEKRYEDGAVLGLCQDLYSRSAFIDSFEAPLLSGLSVMITYGTGYNPLFHKALKQYHADLIIARKELRINLKRNTGEKLTGNIVDRVIRDDRESPEINLYGARLRALPPNPKELLEEDKNLKFCHMILILLPHLMKHFSGDALKENSDAPMVDILDSGLGVYFNASTVDYFYED